MLARETKENKRKKKETKNKTEAKREETEASRERKAKQKQRRKGVYGTRFFRRRSPVCEKSARARAFLFFNYIKVSPSA